MKALIKCNDLVKFYLNEAHKRNLVYQDFNLEVSSDVHLLCLVGPDGAGKSTLFKLLSGLIKPDSGEDYLGDMKPSSSNSEFTSQIGYMSQTLGLYLELTVFENLKILSGIKNFDLKNEEKLLTLLKKVDLYRFRNYEAGSLSGGMKQKLALTCALACSPKFLILDEPTVGVDPVSRGELWAIIFDYLKESNAYCIFSSAYLEEAQKSDLVLMLDEGKIIKQGKASELIKECQDEVYAIKLRNLDFGHYVRYMMFITNSYDKESPILDVCPRVGQIEVLLLSEKTQDDLINYLKNIFKDTFYNMEVFKRSSCLEDVYIKATLDTNLKMPQINLKLLESKNNVDATKSKSYSFGKSNINDKCSNDESSGEECCNYERCDNHEKSNSNYKDNEEVVIDVHEIKKVFGNFTAVEKSNFKVRKGEIFGLLGPNGAGKTTTFRMICALLTPTQGEVLVNGFNLRTAKSSARSTIGYVSQKFSLYRKLTCRQNLEYFGMSYGLSGKYLKERINELVKEFSLTKFEHTKAENLPFGIGRQLSMACALIHKPKILFLDEATSGADPTARRNFWNRVNALCVEGTSIIVTTHFMEEAEYCDRFLIQDHGKILVLGKPNEICVENGKRISVQDSFIKEVQNFRKNLKEEK